MNRVDQKRRNYFDRYEIDCAVGNKSGANRVVGGPGKKKILGFRFVPFGPSRGKALETRRWLIYNSFMN